MAVAVVDGGDDDGGGASHVAVVARNVADDCQRHLNLGYYYCLNELERIVLQIGWMKWN